MITLAKLLYRLGREMDEYGNSEVISVGVGAGYGKDVFTFHLRRPEGVVRLFVADNPVMNDWQWSREHKKPVPEKDFMAIPEIKEGEKVCFVVTGGTYPPETLCTYHSTLRAFKEHQTTIVTTCLEFFETKTLEDGYRLFAVFEKGVAEVKLGEENAAGRMVRKELNLKKLLLAGEFWPQKEEQK